MRYHDTIRRDCAKRFLDAAIHRFLDATDRNEAVHQAFLRLLAVVQDRSVLLHRTLLGGYKSWTQPTRFLKGLVALAQQQAHWLREPDDWRPVPNNLQQFGSLARHLLAKSPVPTFMDGVWFLEPSTTSRQQQKWFRHLAMGGNIRGTDIPVRLTKAMARHFSLAPDHYSVEEALRWGQVRGWGGDKDLVRVVISTRLGSSLEHDEYWSGIIRFLVQNADLLLSHIGPVIEYLYFHKFVFRLEEPVLPRDRKTVLSLLKKVCQWQPEGAHHSGIPSLTWDHSGIGGFQHDEGWERTWTIRELTNSSELTVEGKVMRHCVASYASLCSRRLSSIWSMMCTSYLGQKRVLTIEVDPAIRMIVQARGKRNARPSPAARGIMEKWAAKEGLRVAEGV